MQNPLHGKAVGGVHIPNKLLLRANYKLGGIFDRLCNHQISEMKYQLFGHTGNIARGVAQRRHGFETVGKISEHSAEEMLKSADFEARPRICEALSSVTRPPSLQRSRRECVSHAAVGNAGNEHGRPVVNVDTLVFGDEFKPTRNTFGGNAAEIESLAAGKNGGRELVHLGGGENENNVSRRLLKGF